MSAREERFPVSLWTDETRRLVCAGEEDEEDEGARRETGRGGRWQRREGGRRLGRGKERGGQREKREEGRKKYKEGTREGLRKMSVRCKESVKKKKSCGGRRA